MRYTVEITETLKMTVSVEASSSEEAERIVSDKWRKSEYILDSDNFVGAVFSTVKSKGECYES